MSKSDKHAESSAKKYGGKAADYIEIHELMDSSKSSWGIIVIELFFTLHLDVIIFKKFLVLILMR